MPSVAPVYTRPGVYSQENLAPTPPSGGSSSSTAGFIGEHWRGPVGVAVLCTKWQDFVTIFGGFNPSAVPVLANNYLAYAVYFFFLNGGGQCYVARVMSSTTPGASASVTLKDGAATPQNTLSLTAGYLGQYDSPGTWGNELFVDVVAGSSSNRFGLNVYYGSYSAADLVESWPDLSMNLSDPRYALTILNSPTQGSLYVIAANLSDTNAANAPATQSGTQLTDGTDPGDPASTDLVNALTAGSSPFDTVQGVLNIAVPGQTSSTVLGALITYADTGRSYSFAVIDTPSGETPASAVTYEGTLSPDSHSALYYPWLLCQDPSSSNPQATILLPPSGHVLGQIALTDAQEGPWKAPAGRTSVLQGVAKAERILAPADLGTLNAANVNALRSLPNGSVVIWGARTLDPAFSSHYVPVRRTLNYAEANLAEILDVFVFDANDAVTWALVSSACSVFLDEMQVAGAFGSNGYYVTCDSSNNTPQTIAQGLLNVTVGMDLLYPIEFVVLTLSQIQGQGGVAIS